MFSSCLLLVKQENIISAIDWYLLLDKVIQSHRNEISFVITEEVQRKHCRFLGILMAVGGNIGTLPGKFIKFNHVLMPFGAFWNTLGEKLSVTFSWSSKKPFFSYTLPNWGFSQSRTLVREHCPSPLEKMWGHGASPSPVLRITHVTCLYNWIFGVSYALCYSDKYHNDIWKEKVPTAMF